MLLAIKCFKIFIDKGKLNEEKKVKSKAKMHFFTKGNKGKPMIHFNNELFKVVIYSFC